MAKKYTSGAIKELVIDVLAGAELSTGDALADEDLRGSIAENLDAPMKDLKGTVRVYGLHDEMAVLMQALDIDVSGFGDNKSATANEIISAVQKGLENAGRIEGAGVTKPDAVAAKKIQPKKRGKH